MEIKDMIMQLLYISLARWDKIDEATKFILEEKNRGFLKPRLMEGLKQKNYEVSALRISTKTM